MLASTHGQHNNSIKDSLTSSSSRDEKNRMISYPSSSTLSTLSQSSSSSVSNQNLNPNAPQFEGEMMNITVPLSRDVVFECVVNNLGSYKVRNALFYSIF